MWEAISTVLTGSSAVAVLAAIFLLAILFGVFAKLGILSIHGKGLKVGHSPDALGERYILRKQIDYVRAHVSSKEEMIRALMEKNKEGTSAAYKEDPEYYIKWIIEAAISYISTNWVLLNNITPDPRRNASRAHDMLLYLSSLSGNGEFVRRVFSKVVETWGLEILDNLHRIRQDYSSGARH